MKRQQTATLAGGRQSTQRALPGARRKTLRAAVVTLLVALVAGTVCATTYRLLSPTEIFMQADVVVTARVTDVTAAVRDDLAFDGVYTTVTFEIEELLAETGADNGNGGQDDTEDDEPTDELPDDGAAEDPQSMFQRSELTLDFLGGEAVGDRRLLVVGSPNWQTGEAVLLAAYLDDELASPVVGFRQGVWRLSGDAYVDLDGVPLGLDAVGRLVRTELPASAAEVLQAVRTLLVEGPPAEPEAPAELEDEPDSEPEAEAATKSDSDQEVADEQPAEPPSEPAPEPPTEPDGESNAEPATADEESAEPAPAPEPTRADYRVEDSGGPLLLSERVEAAAATWRNAAGSMVQLGPSASSANVFRYGNEELFSDGMASLTLVADDGVTVLVSPATDTPVAAALQHEFGLLLGLPAAGPGVMAMSVSETQEPPGALEVAELEAVRRFPPADLTRDGTVDFLDLLEFSRLYGRSGLNLPGDLDGNGQVDDVDLDLLREGYDLSAPRRPE